MNLPLPIGSGKLSAHIRALREQAQRLRPVRSAGVLTSYTTGGVSRRAAASSLTASRRSNQARWA
jgi:hypothetical protein